jgi:diguanylate cyclase (GGDEF)-like protein/PAS domain S-box-containing protein
MTALPVYDPPHSAEQATLEPLPQGLWRHPAFWPLLVLVVSLLVTAFFWRNARLDSDRELQKTLQQQTSGLKQRIEAQLASDALVLKGFEGLFNGSSSVDRGEFRRYFETVRSGTLNAGFVGIAFHRLLTDAQLPAHVAGVRQEGFPEYHIQPPGTRAAYGPLTYIEPFETDNRSELGFDHLTIEEERVAVERARDSGEVKISSRLMIKRAGATAEPGFFMYVPLYRRPAAVTNIAQRREAFVGWVDAQFRMSALLSHMFPRGLEDLDIEIFDGTSQAGNQLLYRSSGDLAKAAASPDQFQSENEIVFGGHHWTLLVRALPSFGAAAVRQKPQFVASVGALFSAVLSLLTLALTSALRRSIARERRLATQQLEGEQRKQQEWLRLVLQASDAGTWEWNLRNKINAWSDQMWRLHGDQSHRLQTTKALWKHAVHPEDQHIVHGQVQQAVREGRKFELEYRVQVDGSERWLMARGYPDVQADGQVERYLGIVLDTTESKRAEQRNRVAAVAFESPEGKTITDPRGTILQVNKAFSQITGYSAEEVIGKNPRILQSGLQDATFYKAMWDSILATGSWQGEIWNRRKSGEAYPEWLSIRAVRGDDGVVCNYVATFTDITHRKTAQDTIERLVSYDALTDLPNRSLLLDLLGRALARSQRHAHHGALLIINLDGFKTLNDSLGHAVGDQLLIEVASRLRLCIRGDDTVARLGGDEFVVILEDLDDGDVAATQAEAIARKILNQLSVPYALQVTHGDGQLAHSHHSTASIGLTLFRQHTLSVDELLMRADTAMYQAKKAGRNTLRFFDPQVQASVKARSDLQADLRIAIDQHQLLLHYQPQVDSSDRVTGAEALVRWQHPQRGLVSPAEFISLAEETGLIVPLGNWVLKTACTQLAAWSTDSALAHLSLAVNVSANQFKQGNFVEHLVELLAQTGARPDRLKLELTESLLLENTEDVIATMHVLKARGICFSLDDFGTGYSSLAYLKRLPLDQLKIDQSFVRDVLIDPNDAAIARTVIALGQSMRLAVIAEGVETQGQRDFLLSSGCHAYQGYFFSRPLPLEGFEMFVHGKTGIL